MSKIIISYNPNETKNTSNLLYNYLMNRFGAGVVTLGTDHITDEASAEEALSLADSLVVMIGNKWVELGAYHAPTDSNRLAIATALRLGKQVIPVLVSHARMPTTNDLPTDLHALTTRESTPFVQQTVKDDSARIADWLARGRTTSPKSQSASAPESLITSQPDAPSPSPVHQEIPPVAQTPVTPPSVSRSTKPVMEKLSIPMSIPMLEPVDKFVRPLFTRLGTLRALLVSSAVLFGLWFFLTSAISADRTIRGIIAAVLLAGVLYLFFYLLGILLPKLTFKTSLVVIIGFSLLTFLFMVLDRLFIFTFIYLIGSGGVFGFAYSHRNTITPIESEPRLAQNTAVRFALTVSGLVSAMWMLYAYSGGFDVGNRNFAALMAGALFGAALAYVVHDALDNAPAGILPSSEPVQ